MAVWKRSTGEFCSSGKRNQFQFKISGEKRHRLYRIKTILSFIKDSPIAIVKLSVQVVMVTQY